jgi:hypothetical protein
MFVLRIFGEKFFCQYSKNWHILYKNNARKNSRDKYFAVDDEIGENSPILETGHPALFVSGWFAKMLTAATVVCST